MTAIFQKEFKSFFNNMIGYVVVAALCFFFGFSYVNYNVYRGYPYFGIALSGVVVYLLILVPILTMRSLSDERKTRTDQLLLTAPVSVARIVLGKYFAMMAVFAIPLLISCVYPIILSTQTYHSLVIDLVSIFAYFLLGGVYISIGMFISSLTESQIISAVVSFGVFYLMSALETISSHIPETSYINAIGFCIAALIICVIIYIMTKNLYASVMSFLVMVIAIWAVYYMNNAFYAGLLAKLLTAVSFSNGISYFAYGILRVSDLVLFVTVSLVFIFLTCISVQKRRWN